MTNRIEKASQNQSVSQKLLQNKQETSTFGVGSNSSKDSTVHPSRPFGLLEKATLDGKNPIKEPEKSHEGIKHLSIQREIRSTEHDVSGIKEQDKSQIPNQVVLEVDRANVKPSENLKKVTPNADDNPMFVSISVCAFNYSKCNYRITNMLLVPNICLLFSIIILIHISDHGHIW